MRKEEPSNNVKLAATNALLNSLEFTKANFDKDVRCFLQTPPPFNVTLFALNRTDECVLPVSDGATLHHAGRLRSHAVSRHQSE